VALVPVDASWTWSPGVLIALAAYAALYVGRWRRVRAERGPRGADFWRLAAFTGGLVAVFVALISPIDRLAEQMFVWHMAQHVLLLDVASILLLAGLSPRLLRPITARVRRLEEAAGPLAHPAAGALLYIGTLWMWHIPAMYQLALRDSFVHALQHLNLMTVGLLFWWHVIRPIPPRRALRGMAVGAYMASTKFFTGILASAVTFSPIGFYAYYSAQPRSWGMTLEDDQNLAGALMMTEELIVMTTAFMLMFIRMLSESERDEQRAERYGVSS